ncbi:unnamed protein product [Amoebophrya sp. A120]|nr:unnamed protein product [Amoebophrya sp. A120]|eukprot:GSA120T00007964001.1
MAHVASLLHTAPTLSTAEAASAARFTAQLLDPLSVPVVKPSQLSHLRVGIDGEGFLRAILAGEAGGRDPASSVLPKSPSLLLQLAKALHQNSTALPDLLRHLAAEFSTAVARLLEGEIDLVFVFPTPVWSRSRRLEGKLPRKGSSFASPEKRWKNGTPNFEGDTTELVQSRAPDHYRSTKTPSLSPDRRRRLRENLLASVDTESGNDLELALVLNTIVAQWEEEETERRRTRVESARNRLQECLDDLYFRLFDAQGDEAEKRQSTRDLANFLPVLDLRDLAEQIFEILDEKRVPWHLSPENRVDAQLAWLYRTGLVDVVASFGGSSVGARDDINSGFSSSTPQVAQLVTLGVYDVLYGTSGRSHSHLGGCSTLLDILLPSKTEQEDEEYQTPTAPTQSGARYLSLTGTPLPTLGTPEFTWRDRLQRHPHLEFRRLFEPWADFVHQDAYAPRDRPKFVGLSFDVYLPWLRAVYLLCVDRKNFCADDYGEADVEAESTSGGSSGFLTSAVNLVSCLRRERGSRIRARDLARAVRDPSFLARQNYGKTGKIFEGKSPGSRRKEAAPFASEMMREGEQQKERLGILSPNRKQHQGALSSSPYKSIGIEGEDSPTNSVVLDTLPSSNAASNRSPVRNYFQSSRRRRTSTEGAKVEGDDYHDDDSANSAGGENEKALSLNIAGSPARSRTTRAPSTSGSVFLSTAAFSSAPGWHSETKDADFGATAKTAARDTSCSAEISKPVLYSVSELIHRSSLTCSPKRRAENTSIKAGDARQFTGNQLASLSAPIVWQNEVSPENKKMATVKLYAVSPKRGQPTELKVTREDLEKMFTPTSRSGSTGEHQDSWHERVQPARGDEKQVTHGDLGEDRAADRVYYLHRGSFGSGTDMYYQTTPVFSRSANECNEDHDLFLATRQENVDRLSSLLGIPSRNLSSSLRQDQEFLFQDDLQDEQQQTETDTGRSSSACPDKHQSSPPPFNIHEYLKAEAALLFQSVHRFHATGSYDYDCGRPRGEADRCAGKGHDNDYVLAPLSDCFADNWRELVWGSFLPEIQDVFLDQNLDTNR